MRPNQRAVPVIPDFAGAEFPMSDHDRGAYTPHHDAPLSFDARRSRGRRAFPTTLLLSLMVLVGLGVAIFMFYKSGVPTGTGAWPAPRTPDL